MRRGQHEQGCGAPLGAWGEQRLHITYLSVRIILHRLGFYVLKEFTGFVPNRIVVFSCIARQLNISTRSTDNSNRYLFGGTIAGK